MSTETRSIIAEAIKYVQRAHDEPTPHAAADQAITDLRAAGYVIAKPVPSFAALEAAVKAWNAAEPVHEIVGISYVASFAEMLTAAYTVDFGKPKP